MNELGARKLTQVSALFRQCSFNIHPERSDHGEVAASDCCGRHATSMVRSGTNLLSRCAGHEGMVTLGVTGEVVYEVPA